MSKSPTPKGTPVQRSPSDGVSEGLQSPQHSTPSIGPQHKKRISSLLQSPSFREELDVLIQEQMKKGGSSSNLWALRQLADFMASHGSPASLPVSPSNMMMVTPINDLHGWEPGSMVKGERLMRCKLASTHRLFDLFGWAQIGRTCLTLRVSKEQEHFLVLPDGLAYSEVTGSSLVKVNILGEVVEKGSTNLGVDTEKFSLHSAIYSARPDVRCLFHLHTPATAAVSAMKSGLLPLSHEALLVGDVAYYDYNGVMEEEEDRVELQKSLGPTCKVLVLRNHGIVALGESVEEAFYTIYHIQAACQIQVSALCCAGGEQNLIMLDRTIHKPTPAGTVGWAGSTFGPLHKSRVGEHEFEALMRTLDNLGYRTGYAYRFPVLLERTRTRREVEVPATVTAFHQFDDDGVHPALRQHPFAQRQQQERTRWLNTPNTYQKVSQEQASPGHQRTTWLKTEEVTQAGSTAIKIENPNQFVPLFTNPQEVIETRNKIRQQNRQDMKTAGPQSQVLASVITEDSPPSPVSPPKVPPEPEPPNPFNELTDQELEEYRKEVQRKQDGGTNEEEVANDKESSPTTSPTKGAPPSHPPLSEETKTDSPAIQNGGEEEKQTTEELEKGMKALSTNDTSTPAAPPAKPQGGTPEGSPSKSPSKKKKKFKPPSFLKKSKKQKEKAET
ncbi:beta-adducin isoform X1 [Pundamilia nyererei]|uniref:Adducin 2 (beta) n=3 Tax=Haplochromini TaxID=319058 RepID=A0A3P9AWD3_9CICH|nr:beta-adducin isoform X1 [Maylandia zebra]XP_012779032.2 beta-adducin isoform X1 [Maylandia zebra]XP_012779033.2 beta-adducin isoform X1 [Maylandia zebra]XP_013769580.1 PREDICTED: beta-adducin-like isoform X1 [Pundamilia nyererei]XP_013769581.1 PREDICTED: beta-adducin-like isoform X1 [Pundamilia nyererei]XP_013769582.1 PREDICTED: beta-adducin-like isoform X1 [Pundamilia nyererei]XP_014196473.1 beta-adducin isoform X1 [Haplochromis burtoni]XP_014196474.1 beta-adducin isoform X1 [Haplochromi